MITERQEELLNYLVKQYLDTAQPVSSFDLKRVINLDVSAATIRNDLQVLSEYGFIDQPHTSSGRVPTQKAYKYFTEKFCQNPENEFTNFILNEIKKTKQQIEQELKLVQDLTKSLSYFSMTLTIKTQNNISEKDELLDILNILGSAKPSHEKNIEIIKSLLRDFNI